MLKGKFIALNAYIKEKAEIQWLDVFLRKLEKEQETIKDGKNKHNSKEYQRSQKFFEWNTKNGVRLRLI